MSKPWTFYILIALMLCLSGGALPETVSREQQTSAWKHFNQSKKYLKQKQIRPALKSARAAEKANPGNGLFPAHVGNIHREHLKQYKLALKAFRRAQAAGYKEAWLARVIAYTLSALKKHNEAVIVMEKAVRVHPNDVDTVNTLANMLVRRGQNFDKQKKYRQAHKDFTIAYRTAPGLDFVVMYYGVSLSKIGKLDQSIIILEKGRQNHPKFKWMPLNLAYVYVQRGRKNQEAKKRKEALVDFQKAYKLNRADYISLHYGIALRNLNRFEQALKIFKLCEQAHPKFPHCRSNRPYTYLLAIKHHKNKKATTARWVKKALKVIDAKRPYKTWNRLLVSAVFEGLKVTRDKGAYERIRRKLLREFPREPLVYENLGLLLFELNGGLENKASPEIIKTMIRLRRKGMQLYENAHPGRAHPGPVGFPLGGHFQVWTHFNANVWSHVGLYGKYCYDLVNVTPEGKPLKPGRNGRKNENYITFGKPLFAVRDGVVEKANDENHDQKPGNYSGNKSNSIWLKHADGYSSFYTHLKYGSLKVKKGQKVKRGQVIGAVGNTGPSTGPHLHFCMIGKDAVTLDYRFPRAPVRTGKGETLQTGGPYRKGWIIKTN